MFEVIKINDTGRANFLEWLESNLKNPINAVSFADALIPEVDGKDPEASVYIELARIYTRDGNPTEYGFHLSEYDVVTLDDDGNELNRRKAA